MPRRPLFRVLVLMFFGVIGDVSADSILLQSTTSTANSGLYDAILPQFTAATGITVHVVAVGTGQAIKNAKNGDADVLLVHAKAAEEQFVRDGYGVARHDVMYNDFVIVGPQDDPAGIRGLNNAVVAMKRISENRHPFTSRGDDSGTHKKEMRLWEKTGIDPVQSSGTWYRETGSGMGATLNVTSGMDAYTLTDRATWLSFKNRGRLEILTQDDPDLFNQYGVILVNPQRHPTVNGDAGQAFIDWLLSEEGQTAIAAYQLEGQQLYFPNAAP